MRCRLPSRICARCGSWRGHCCGNEWGTKPSPLLNVACRIGTGGLWEVNADAIADGVTVAADGQCRQILKALATSPEVALKTLDQRFTDTDPKSGATTRARLAIVALHLGDSRRAVELCALAANPDAEAGLRGDAGGLARRLGRVDPRRRADWEWSSAGRRSL